MSKNIHKLIEKKREYKFTWTRDDVSQGGINHKDGGYIGKGKAYLTETNMRPKLDRLNSNGVSYRDFLEGELKNSPYKEAFLSNFDELAELVRYSDMSWKSDLDCLNCVSSSHKEIAGRLLMELRGLEELPNPLPNLDDFNDDLVENWGVEESEATFYYADERRIYGGIKSIYGSPLSKDSEQYLMDMLPTPPSGFRWSLDYDRHGRYYVNICY